MMRRFTVLFLSFLLFSIASFAQIRKVPPAVTASFTKQYPAAQNISYKDNLNAFHVVFTLDGAQMTAKYNSKGEWKETEKVIAQDTLPTTVLEGFQKSKYTDWTLKESVLILHPSGVEQYRLKVEKNELQKKHLFYTKSGRLIRDSITI